MDQGFKSLVNQTLILIKTFLKTVCYVENLGLL